MPRRMPPRPPKGTTPPNAGRRFPPEPLTADEARQLINAPSKRAPTGRRNAAMLAIAYRCGLRCAEILSLEERDVDVAAGTINVRCGKGRKARIVGADAGTLALVERWLEAKRKRKIRAPFLFTTLTGLPVDASYCRGMIRRMAKRAGIQKRAHFHGLRHTYAAELAREGIPMNTIQAALGHSNLGTTSRYLAHVDPREVVDAMRSRSFDVQPKPTRKPTARNVARALDEAGVSMEQLAQLLSRLTREGAA